MCCETGWCYPEACWSNPGCLWEQTRLLLLPAGKYFPMSWAGGWYAEFDAFGLMWQTVFFPEQICKEYHVSVNLDWTLLQCKSDDEYGEMQEIIASRDLEHQSDARWLASVYFKNSINRYWRIRRDSLWATWSFCLFSNSFLVSCP